MGSVKVCEFCGLQSTREKYQFIGKKLHFPRPDSSLNKNNCYMKSERTHFLSVLTDRVCQPSATVRVAPLYWMCGRVAYLHVAFPCHVAKVCEEFVNFEKIFLYEPCRYHK